MEEVGSEASSQEWEGQGQRCLAVLRGWERGRGSEKRVFKGENWETGCKAPGED